MWVVYTLSQQGDWLKLKHVRPRFASHSQQQSEELYHAESFSVSSPSEGSQPELPGDHVYLGQRVARTFVNHELVLGTVDSWQPADADNDQPLFHVRHDDGDEEDLYEWEVEDALLYAQEIMEQDPERAFARPVAEGPPFSSSSTCSAECREQPGASNGSTKSAPQQRRVAQSEPSATWNLAANARSEPNPADGMPPSSSLVSNAGAGGKERMAMSMKDSENASVRLSREKRDSLPTNLSSCDNSTKFEQVHLKALQRQHNEFELEGVEDSRKRQRYVDRLREVMHT